MSPLYSIRRYKFHGSKQMKLLSLPRQKFAQPHSSHNALISLCTANETQLRLGFFLTTSKQLDNFFLLLCTQKHWRSPFSSFVKFTNPRKTRNKRLERFSYLFLVFQKVFHLRVSSFATQFKTPKQERSLCRYFCSASKITARASGLTN